VFGISDSSYIKATGFRMPNWILCKLLRKPLDNNIIDFYMIQNQLKAPFSIDKLKSYEWNPAEYNVCGAFAEILNGKYDSLEVRSTVLI
jgi:hypothetical protein